MSKIDSHFHPTPSAGLVLLSNYYQMLFERIGLVHDKLFTSFEAQQRATHILQYVAAGQTQTEETHLPLNKILCGLTLSDHGPDRIEMKDEEKKLVDGLLKAAISHWPAIGECSIDGFRGNWLMRNGGLTELEERWELAVDKRAYDVLIHKCPYAFSIIHYPWMKKPLHVTWPY